MRNLKWSYVGWCLAASALLLPVAVLGQTEDLSGSSDHPMVSRYEGSVIDAYEVSEYSDFDLPLGPMVRNDEGNRVASNQETLEGKIT